MAQTGFIDRFLDDAVEVDVDAIRDATGEVIIGGIMEHVEQAGVHSGDSACVLPPQSLSALDISELETATKLIAKELDVRGLINVQFAVQDGHVFVIEANPRASRTVPFVAKATGVPLAMVASRVMTGSTLAELRIEGLLTEPVIAGHVSVKEAVLPFNRFPEVDPVLGPEMRSTGEVMGIDRSFGLAYAKSQLAASNGLPSTGTVFLSLADRDKASAVRIARPLLNAGLHIAATAGTAEFLRSRDIVVSVVVRKLSDPPSNGDPSAVDLIENGTITLVINTPRGSGAYSDGADIRRACTINKVPVHTTIAAALATVTGIDDWANKPFAVKSLQSHLGTNANITKSA